MTDWTYPSHMAEYAAFQIRVEQLGLLPAWEEATARAFAQGERMAALHCAGDGCDHPVRVRYDHLLRAVP